MECATCGSENRAGARFCRVCGSPLVLTCPNGHPVAATDRFCDVCGAPVGQPAPVEGPPAEQRAERGESERRLVTVLFADLVGFTGLADGRDSEEVREILSTYFDRLRGIVERHGGTVEKFIGDAVMAVWGTPVAHEDDAERSVRAGLQMTEAVRQMNGDLGFDGGTLALRVGVLTGEAAVTVGATGQGMVAGDLVNTASRVQSAAAPGTVLVGEATRRATEAAVAYEDVGERELKGKAAPVSVWRALRITAGRKGSGRSQGLEAPFVGRDSEMRLVKELAHATFEEGRARLVSVVGVAGIGKSRLSWELEKYMDGLVEQVWWHRGRCLAYGEGITYWALAEMVRMGAGIAEDEEQASAVSKLRDSLERHVSDPEERRWVFPRLAHLLGLEERTAPDREDLFSAWRLFFERMAGSQPVVLLFEDVHWSDAALLDFVEYLLDWSRGHPIFILTLGRPDLFERRPGWGAGRKDFTSLSLEALPPPTVDELLAGLVPGLPEELRARIRDRAEGVPLYAVETVRMLLDRGVLRREGNGYRPTGTIETLDVPETLHALIAARLDGLNPAERAAVQDASVLGKTFTRASLEALTGLAGRELDDVLTALVRKELIALQSDPRSPERGQYGFVQALVREVAYQTISRKDRKARHLAVAEHLDTTWTEDEEIIEVIAAHYMDAYRSAPNDPDAERIKARAREALLRAGRRASSLAASEEAQRYFEQALDLADEGPVRAELAELAGVAAWTAGRSDRAKEHFETAIELFEGAGASHPAARVSARLAESFWDAGDIDEGLERMERAYAILSQEEPDEDLATLAAQLGRMHFFRGDPEGAWDPTERALEISERLGIREVLSNALNTKSLLLDTRGRHEEAQALLKHALAVALDADAPSAALRAYYNLFSAGDIDEVIEYARRGLELARRRGNRYWELNFYGRLASALWEKGSWDQALEVAEPLVGPDRSGVTGIALSRAVPALVHIHVNRGSVPEAERILSLREEAQRSAGIIERLDYLIGRAMVARARGDLETALATGAEVIAIGGRMGSFHESIREGCAEALEAMLQAGRLDEAAETMAILEERPSPGDYIRIHLVRFGARLAAAGGDDGAAEAGFTRAAERFREARMPFWLAVVLLEEAEWLAGRARPGEAAALLDEAALIFEGLGAAPWLERVGRARGGQAAAVTAADT